MRRAILFLLACGSMATGQTLAPAVKAFVKVDAPVIALTHVRVIDGTGAPPAEDETIVIDHGRIQSVGPSDRAQPPSGARRMDLRNHTLIPGLVGMYEHLFYTSGAGVLLYIEHGMSFSIAVFGVWRNHRPHGRDAGAIHRPQHQR